MNPEVDRLLREAISGRRLIKFVLDGITRVAEPHDYGTLKGVDRVLVYQVGGGSRSGGLPDWRLVTIDKVSKLEVLDRTFEGPQATVIKRRHHWERMFASVSSEGPSG
ncbi:MAG TPA: hypothetical protein VIG99_12885 [Myxococcaceae bacterium]